MSPNTGVCCVLVCLAASCFLPATEAQNKCVACSYNFAGDGTTDYACVNDSIHFPHSSNITCNFNTHSCVIRTVYRFTGYQQLQSVARDCLPKSATSSEVCGDSDRRICWLECKTDMCNAEPNADLAKIYANFGSSLTTSVPSVSSVHSVPSVPSVHSVLLYFLYQPRPWFYRSPRP